jgi:hypothetical protein
MPEHVWVPAYDAADQLRDGAASCEERIRLAKDTGHVNLSLKNLPREPSAILRRL